jgi:hypothetical protein
LTEREGLSESEQLEYALQWFTHHASQRLQTFNFYLVVATVLLLGYGSALHDKSQSFAILVCAVGVVVTALFFQLEVRNAELVDVGREELKRLERGTPSFSIAGSVKDRTSLRRALGEGLDPFRTGGGSEVVRARADYTWRRAIARHGFVLRSVMTLCALLFLAGFVLAAVGITPDGASESCVEVTSTTSTSLVPASGCG